MEPIKSRDDEETNNDKKALNGYIRYSGIGFQMIAIIGLCTFIGYKIDQYRNSEQLVFSALLGLFGVCAALYMVIKSLKKDQS